MRRGDVHELPRPQGEGHEHSGRLFGVVVQADALLPRSVVLIAPTSHIARPATFRPEMTIDGQTVRVLVAQVGAVSAGHLGDPVGRASTEEMWAIDDGLMTVLDLRA